MFLVCKFVNSTRQTIQYPHRLQFAFINYFGVVFCCSYVTVSQHFTHGCNRNFQRQKQGGVGVPCYVERYPLFDARQRRPVPQIDIHMAVCRQIENAIAVRRVFFGRQIL